MSHQNQGSLRPRGNRSLGYRTTQSGSVDRPAQSIQSGVSARVDVNINSGGSHPRMSTASSIGLGGAGGQPYEGQTGLEVSSSISFGPGWGATHNTTVQFGGPTVPDHTNSGVFGDFFPAGSTQRAGMGAGSYGADMVAPPASMLPSAKRKRIEGGSTSGVVGEVGSLSDELPLFDFSEFDEAQRPPTSQFLLDNTVHGDLDGDEEETGQTDDEPTYTVTMTVVKKTSSSKQQSIATGEKIVREGLGKSAMKFAFEIMQAPEVRSDTKSKKSRE